MPNPDTAVSIHPYFETTAESHEAFLALLPEFLARAQSESGCLYYTFTSNGNIIHCREGYKDSEALLFHVANVGELIEKASALSKTIRLEIHGPASELEKLKGPLAEVPAEYFTIESGFRK